ncbi:hypothetical protein R3P38DRAFT_3243726 [Favolaschia claudopus]|uniref:Uncharacterized protein n=1 Tax=Favolaschia claudopus TaxID=2862362 RepID=A0AAV9Z304_9AGAR
MLSALQRLIGAVLAVKTDFVVEASPLYGEPRTLWSATELMTNMKTSKRYTTYLQDLDADLDSLDLRVAASSAAVQIRYYPVQTQNQQPDQRPWTLADAHAVVGCVIPNFDTRPLLSNLRLEIPLYSFKYLHQLLRTSTEYSCVSFRRRPSTAGNQAYIGLLMERNIFEGQLAESRDNYQKLLDQIPSLRTGEDSSGLATSSLPSNASTLKLHDTADFPQVKW